MVNKYQRAFPMLFFCGLTELVECQILLTILKYKGGPPFERGGN